MDLLRFDFWDALLLCGVIQGMVMSVLASARKERRNAATWFLSATLLIFALHNTLILGYDSHFFNIYPQLRHLPLNLILGFGPCIYFYVFFSLHPGSRPGIFVHFIPVCIQFCYYLLLTLGVNFHIDYPLWKLISQTEQISALTSVCAYTIMSLKIVRNQPQQGTVAGLKIKQVVRSRLSRLLISYAFLWVVWLAYTLADIFCFDYQLHLRDYFPLYLLVAVLTYWIGILAYLHPLGVAADAANKTYSDMNQEEIDRNLSRLLEVMDKEQSYLDPNLSLKILARQTGIPVNLLSFLINNKLDSSFSEWVNRFRIEAIKKQMSSSRFKKITLAGIATECGFNSKATFNRVFKLQTGMTPSEYLNELNDKK